MKERFIINTTVASVSQRSINMSGRKLEDGSVQIETVDAGWFITLKDSHEALGIGQDKPNAKVGCKARVIIEIEVPDDK